MVAAGALVSLGASGNATEAGVSGALDVAEAAPVATETAVSLGVAGTTSAARAATGATCTAAEAAGWTDGTGLLIVTVQRFALTLPMNASTFTVPGARAQTRPLLLASAHALLEVVQRVTWFPSESGNSPTEPSE